MKCRHSENDVALYVEGDVTPAKACEIEAHLTVCTQCRDLAVELRESQAALKALRQDTVSAMSLASVRSDVLAKIQAGVKPVWGRWVYALAGAVFVAVIGVGLSTYMRSGVQQTRQIVKGEIPHADERVAEAPRSTSDNRSLEPTTPSAPAKDASRRSHPSLGQAHSPRREEGVVAHKQRFGVSDHPVRSVKEASRHLLNVASTPPHEEGNNNAHTGIPAEPSEPAKPLVVKLLTDDPNIVIYWLIDQTGGAL